MTALELLVNTIATGAIARTHSPHAEVTRAYNALAHHLAQHYPAINLSLLAQKPESKPRRDTLIEDLSETTASDDNVLWQFAKELALTVDQHALKENDFPDLPTTLCLDIAVPEQTTINRIFQVAASIRQPLSPPLQETGMTTQSSRHVKVSWRMGSIHLDFGQIFMLVSSSPRLRLVYQVN